VAAAFAPSATRTTTGGDGGTDQRIGGGAGRDGRDDLRQGRCRHRRGAGGQVDHNRVAGHHHAQGGTGGAGVAQMHGDGIAQDTDGFRGEQQRGGADALVQRGLGIGTGQRRGADKADDR